MKVLSRVSIMGCLVLALSLIFVPGLTANAQNANCFGLSADDCALFQAATTRPSSFNMAYELTLNASGSNGGSVDLSVKGSGPFEYDGDAASMMTPGAVQKLTMQNTVSTSVATEGKTTTGNLEFRILNGTLYVEGQNLTQGKWYSVDLTQLANSGTLRSRGLGMMGGRMPNPAMMMGLIQAARQLATVPGFIRVERAADTTIENQQIANFVYHIDLPTLFNSPNFAAFVKTVLAQTPNGSRMNDAAIRAISSRMATAFKDTTLTVTRLIGVTDKLPHGVSVDLVMKLDPKALPVGMGAGGLATPDAAAQTGAAQPISVNLHFAVTLSGIGSKATVTAPEGATPFNLGGFGAGAAEPASTPEATAAQ